MGCGVGQDMEMRRGARNVPCGGKTASPSDELVKIRDPVVGCLKVKLIY